MAQIIYKGGYRYQLSAPYSVKIPIEPEQAVDTPFLRLSAEGDLTIEAGYAWDGPSGPAIDTHNFMRGSLVHDALYQLMREGHLDAAVYKDPADRLLRQHCREDGMSALRAWWVYWGVRLFGRDATEPDGGKALRVAPQPV